MLKNRAFKSENGAAVFNEGRLTFAGLWTIPEILKLADMLESLLLEGKDEWQK